MTTIYGTVGYTFLKSKEIKDPPFILILADIHSKLDYCDNFIQVSEWLKKNMSNVNILLEEVSREDFKLGELWSSSDHTIKLKNLYLNNQNKIFDIDIRPYLIPFSWELLEENKNLKNITFKKYLEVLNEFLFVKLDKIKNKIYNVYNSKFLNNHKLKIHLMQIRNNFIFFLNTNKLLMDNYMYDIFKNYKSILIDLNLILDSCMEWYSIAKMYDLQLDNNKNFIIHTGLFHSERIIQVLQKIYKYDILVKDGINDIDDAEKYNHNGCILLPDIITESLTKKDYL